MNVLPIPARPVLTLRNTLALATLLMVLYGMALPTLVLWRLLPTAQSIEAETVASTGAFEALRAQSVVLQGVVSYARTLAAQNAAGARFSASAFADTIAALRNAPRAEYGDLSEQMRPAFANLIVHIDHVISQLDESERALRLGEVATFHARLVSALDSVPVTTRSLDEAQRQGLAELLERQGRVRNASLELVYWTLGWLAVGSCLVWYLVQLTRRRFLVPLEVLEAGLTRLSAGDLEARIPESDDELGRLGAVFNRASDVLRRRAEEQGRFAAAGQLLADVAHEVNNPLMAILGTAETSLASTGLRPEVREDFELIREQGQRAGQLLSGLLRFVRVGEEHAEVVTLASVVARATDLVAYQFPLHSIACTTDFAPDTAPVRTAATRLEQVFVNLLTNAVQAMTDNEGPRRIVVRVWSNGGWSCVSVRDSGPGVAADFRDQLFQPFSSTKGESGTGLGLYICRRIAREGGGDLTYIDANPGAQFVLTLPSSDGVPTPMPKPRRSRAATVSVFVATDGVANDAVTDAVVTHAVSTDRMVTAAAATELAANAKLTPPPEAISPGPLAGINILLVDDEDGVRAAIARYLRRSGATVREAVHGRDALTQIEAQAPDVVLLDLRMPVMDGYAFMAEVNEARPWLEPRVLVLSGDIAAGTSGQTPVPQARMMAKPVVLQELVRRLREVADANAV